MGKLLSEADFPNAILDAVRLDFLTPPTDPQLDRIGPRLPMIRF
jgi:hypothetical protein